MTDLARSGVDKMAQKHENRGDGEGDGDFSR